MIPDSHVRNSFTGCPSSVSRLCCLSPLTPLHLSLGPRRPGPGAGPGIHHGAPQGRAIERAAQRGHETADGVGVPGAARSIPSSHPSDVARVDLPRRVDVTARSGTHGQGGPDRAVGCGASIRSVASGRWGTMYRKSTMAGSPSRRTSAVWNSPSPTTSVTSPSFTGTACSATKSSTAGVRRLSNGGSGAVTAPPSSRAADEIAPRCLAGPRGGHAVELLYGQGQFLCRLGYTRQLEGRRSAGVVLWMGAGLFLLFRHGWRW